MVKIFNAAADKSLHLKCVTCKGTNTECEGLVQCTNATCSKAYHTDCAPPARMPESEEDLGEFPVWYCSETCEKSDETRRAAMEAKGQQEMESTLKAALAKIAMLEKQQLELANASNKISLVNDKLAAENNKLRAEMSANIHSSTSIPYEFHADQIGTTLGAASTSRDAQLFAARQSVLQKAQSYSFDESHAETQAPNISSPSFLTPKADGNYSADEIGQAHAHASIVLGLSERRRQLPKLPEFDGKASDWLHFANSYTELKVQGQYSDKEMVAKLSQALKGDALQYTKLWLRSARPCPEKIIADLKQRFFSETAVVSEILEAVYDVPTIKSKDRLQLDTLKRAVDGYINVCNDIEDTLQLQIRLPEAIEDKLPDDLLEKWTRTCRLKLVKGNWLDFSKFLGEATNDLKVRLADRRKLSSKVDAKQPKAAAKVNVLETQVLNSAPLKAIEYKGRGNANRKNSASNSRPPSDRPRLIGETPPCDYDNCGKQIFRCRGFFNRAYDIKQAHCDRNGYCAKCLRKGHVAVNCPNLKSIPHCKRPGCTDSTNHTTVMHPPACDPQEAKIATFQSRGQAASLFQIVPVLVDDAKGNQILTTAFVDGGSNITIISEKFYKELGLKGEPYNLMANWCAAGVTQNSEGSKKLKITIAPVHNAKERHVLKNVVTMDNLQLPMQEQKEADIHRMFPHLSSIPIPEFDLQRPQILLGLHHRYLTVSESIIMPPSGQSSAVAEKTPLGWVISCANLPQYSLNAIEASEDFRILKPNAKLTLEQLHAIVNRYLDEDISNSVYRDKHFLTLNEKRSMEVLARTMKLVNNRYEVGLLWKNDDIELPDNYSTALRRLKSTEATLKKRDLVEWANEHHKLLIDSGFAREASLEDLRPEIPHKRINYCIGFVVINANKIPPKPRWVVDTAATHEGVSLNSALLKGPDNLIPLTQALFHFRERKFATAGDVQKQFHQIKIIKEDVQCQRYLWRDCNSEQEPRIFIHTAMMFGPTDSPAKANAVRIEHAINCAQSHPHASRAALYSMYMDDQFNSEDTIEQAVETAHQSIDMFSQISWKLLDFRSNEPRVLASLPIDNVNPNALVELSKDDPSLYGCKVLGIFWNPYKDVFQFQQTAEMELRLKTLNEQYRPTKREILSFVMRIFDCLGLISHFIIHGKVILQKIWKEQTGWDDHISEEIFKAWTLWLKAFDQISILEIPRHYGYDSTKVMAVDVHTFCDANPDAYAAVVFLRMEFKSDPVHVFQVMSKCRVAPKKQISIPKLELDAAVLATRITKIVLDQHKRMTIRSIYFHSDSQITLKWIRNVHLKLIAYVASRVGEIRDAFPISAWHYVPSALNPADDGTKSNQIDYGDNMQRWYRGPEFLKRPQSEWPAEPASLTTPTEPSVNTVEATAKELAGIFETVAPKNRANWACYKRIIARFLRVIHNLMCALNSEPKKESDIIEPEELDKAEKVILKNIQRAYWPDETALLMEGRPLNKKHSKLLSDLNPFICADGLMRVRSRIAYEANLPYDTRFPIILPHNHETVDCIARHAHEKNNHFGIEATLARLRAKYWIIGCRGVVKRAFLRCLYCIEMKARPFNIPTGDLPETRVSMSSKAFEHVGADCFGPFSVYCGESYRTKDVNVVLFTCMAARAIYLRRLDRSTSDDMFAAIQELWTRRGPIKTIRSDNGPNFQGCGNLVNKGLREKLSTEFNIKWRFNPPLTPHWGGVFERLIKDVKRAMVAAMKGRRVNERVFDTILYQVEDLINSRPLTHVPVNPNDDIPITPNLLIKLHPGYSFVTGDIPEKPERHERILQRAREFSQKIYKRWAKEYLPIITRNIPKRGPKRDIKLGDYVIYVDPEKRPENWARGIVIQTYLGRDGKCRLADIKLKGGEIIEKRSYHRLALLDINNAVFGQLPDNSHPTALICSFLQNSLNNFSRPERNSHKRVRESEIYSLSFVNSDYRGSAVNVCSVIKHALNKLQQNMEFYSRLSRDRVFELSKSLAKTKFSKSYNISANAIEDNARKVYETSLVREFIDDNNNYTVKLESPGGIPSFMDLLVTLASLRVKATWITIDDTSKRAPIVAFIMVEKKPHKELLMSFEVISTIEMVWKTALPISARHMPLYDDGYEHALIRWWPLDDEEWKIILSRRVNTIIPNAMPRSAPLMDRVWEKRFSNHIDFTQPILQWTDSRVRDMSYYDTHLRCNHSAPSNEPEPVTAQPTEKVEVRSVHTQTPKPKNSPAKKLKRRREITPPPTPKTSTSAVKPRMRSTIVVPEPARVPAARRNYRDEDIDSERERELLRSDDE